MQEKYKSSVKISYSDVGGVRIGQYTQGSFTPSDIKNLATSGEFCFRIARISLNERTHAVDDDDGQGSII